MYALMSKGTGAIAYLAESRREVADYKGCGRCPSGGVGYKIVSVANLPELLAKMQATRKREGYYWSPRPKLHRPGIA